MVMYAASREFDGYFWCCSSLRVVRHRFKFESSGLSVLAIFFSRFLGWTTPPLTIILAVALILTNLSDNCDEMMRLWKRLKRGFKLDLYFVNVRRLQKVPEVLCGMS